MLSSLFTGMKDTGGEDAQELFFVACAIVGSIRLLIKRTGQILRTDRKDSLVDVYLSRIFI